MKPLLKWAGGKRHIAEVLESHLPSDWNEGTFYEPFLGGAALYLHLNPKKASLSDVNSSLIGFYQAVKDFPDDLLAAIGDSTTLNFETNTTMVRQALREQLSFTASTRFVSMGSIARTPREVSTSHLDRRRSSRRYLLKNSTKFLQHSNVPHFQWETFKTWFRTQCQVISYTSTLPTYLSTRPRTSLHSLLRDLTWEHKSA